MRERQQCKDGKPLRSIQISAAPCPLAHSGPIPLVQTSRPKGAAHSPRTDHAQVSFSCEQCCEVMKKPKLDAHAQRCWGAQFTCSFPDPLLSLSRVFLTEVCHSGYAGIDCNTTFEGTAYRAHTSCVSEEQRYQSVPFFPPFFFIGWWLNGAFLWPAARVCTKHPRARARTNSSSSNSSLSNKPLRRYLHPHPHPPSNWSNRPQPLRLLPLPLAATSAHVKANRQRPLRARPARRRTAMWR